MTKIHKILINIFITGFILLFIGVVLSLIYKEVFEGTFFIIIKSFLYLGATMMSVSGVLVSAFPIKK